MTTCDVCFISVHCSFRDCVSLAHRAWNCLTSDKSLSLRDFNSDAGLRKFGRRRYGRFFLAIAGLLVSHLIDNKTTTKLSYCVR